MFRFWLHPQFIYKQTKMFVEECKAKAHSAFSFTDDIIKNISEHLSNESEIDEKPNSFMRALMSPKFNLPESEIRDEIKTLLIAVCLSKIYYFRIILIKCLFSGSRYIRFINIRHFTSSRNAQR